MASITITVPDALVPRVVAAMRATHPEVSELTDANAFKEVTAAIWRRKLIAYEAVAARQSAEDAAAATAAADAAQIV